jgi:hypothetical protein
MFREGNPIQFCQTMDKPEDNIWACMFDYEPDGSEKQLWLLRVHTYLSYEIIDNKKVFVGMKHGALILEQIQRDGGKDEDLICYKRLGIAFLARDSAEHFKRRGEHRRVYQGREKMSIKNPWVTHSAEWHYDVIKII